MSNTVKTMEEFNTLYSMGKILTICDQFQIPKSKQPSNRQHFQLLQRYVNNPQLLTTIWQNALAKVESAIFVFKYYYYYYYSYKYY